MSANRHSVRKTRRPAPRPASVPVAPLLAVADEATEVVIVPAVAVAESVPAPLAAAQPVPALSDREALVELHFTRISALLAKAERIAEAMLDSLMTKLQRREPAYPGELIHICRGLHVLAKCGAELSRGNRKAATLTAAQVTALEARLRKAFGM